MTGDQTTQLFLALAVILVCAQLFGRAAHRLGQPAVVGEILAGIVLGPTLFHGALSTRLFPLPIRPDLTALSDLGIALFMFLVGLEADHALLRGRRAATGVIALASTAVPFGLGVGFAMVLARRQPEAHRTAFVLFLGTAMAVTAFPVLARILDERRLTRTQIGALALGSAALGDVLAWAMLAVVVRMADPSGQPLWRIALVPVYVAVLALVERPLLDRAFGGSPAAAADGAAAGDGRVSASNSARGLAAVLVIVLGSAAFLEWTGLNFIFGAFAAGMLMPRGERGRIGEQIRERLEPLSRLLLMPVFFVIAGFNVDLATLGPSGLGTLGLLLLVAVGGKYAGAVGGARLAGVGLRQSAALGTLMNARGLTELVVLTTGVQAGVLDHRIYSMMVVMTLLTTAMAGPLLDRLVVARPSGLPLSWAAGPVLGSAAEGAEPTTARR